MTSELQKGLEREKQRMMAAQRILDMLRNSLALMTVPYREEAYELAEKYELPAKDILDAAYRRARNT